MKRAARPKIKRKSAANNASRKVILEHSLNPGVGMLSSDQLGIVLENICDGIIVQDRNYRCVYANQAGATLCGYSSPEEFINLNISDSIDRFEILTESGEPFPLEQLPARLALLGTPNPFETVLQSRSKETGVRTWASVTARPILNEAGEPYLAVSIFRDVTYQKQTESALRANEKQLRLSEIERVELLRREQLARKAAELERSRLYSLFMQSPAIINIMRGPEHVFELCNPMARALLGGRDLTGVTVREAVSEEGKGFVRILDQVYLTGNSFNQKEMLSKLKQPDGTFVDRYFNITLQPWFDVDGELAGILNFSIDVTEEVLSKRRLDSLLEEVRQSEDQFRTLAETQAFLAESSSVLSSSLHYNETLQAVAKLAVPGLADWCFIDVLEEKGPRSIAIAHPDPVMRKLGDELRSKFPIQGDAPSGSANVIRTGRPELYPNITDELLVEGIKDKERLQLIRTLGMRSAIIVPLHARGKTLGALTLISTKESRRYGQADLQIGIELGRRAGMAIDNANFFEQAQAAIQARDEFLSIASHELKTPLTSLKLQTQLNLRRFEKEDSSLLDKGRVGKLLRTATRQVDRLSRLVEDMFDISRLIHGRLSLKLERLDLGQLVKDIVESFSEQLNAGGCRHQVIIGGAVMGHCDRYRMEQVITNLLANALKYGGGKPIEISVLASDGKGMIRVKDQGIGIAKENLDRVFQRFERVVSSNNISGLGLGLYICQQIMDAHGGRIHIKSELGKGSVFTVELPLR